MKKKIYFELVYLVTDFVPSLTACLANSPGSNSRTDVWISRLEIVDLPLWWANLDDSLAILSNISFTNEFTFHKTQRLRLWNFSQHISSENLQIKHFEFHWNG